MNTDLDPKSMKAAVDQLKAGVDPKLVLNFIYGLGLADGMLEMAKNSTQALMEELRKAA